MSWKSLADRKRVMLEDCCGGMGGGGDAGGDVPTSSVGDAGFQTAAPATGPRAGLDKVLGRRRERRSKK
jgi:hypothetical protein